MDSSRIFTVTEINASIRGLLESRFPFVSVAGEISNLRQPLSGHLYFTLKDEQSQIKAVLFKIQQRYLADIPADGKMVVCRGRISVYEPRGDYQLIVDAIDFHGTGALQLQFEQLKKKLAAEGLFDKTRKKPLPLFPDHVTLITSPRGAAVHDFIRIARRRWPRVKIAVYPVTVQGPQAAAEICEGIENVNASFAESIIVLCRGGGSLEDLWGFNEEKVARAIDGSRLPVVSAVGHDIDFTIADFAADLRAPTPSAAAEMILPDAGTVKLQITQLQKRLMRKIQGRLDYFELRIAGSRHRLVSRLRPLDQLTMQLDHAAADLGQACRRILAHKQHVLERTEQRLLSCNPITTLLVQRQRLADLHRRLIVAGKSLIDSRHEALLRSAALLDAVSPLATLARGYAIVRADGREGQIITDSEQVEAGEKIDILLHRGRLECTVEKTGKSRFNK